MITTVSCALKRTRAITHCRNTAKTDEKIAGPYSECFWHLQSILNLAWYPKSRSHGTHKCCQQRCTALTAFQAAIFGATQVSPPICVVRSTFQVSGSIQHGLQMSKTLLICSCNFFICFLCISAWCIATVIYLEREAPILVSDL